MLIKSHDDFKNRHIGPRQNDLPVMLDAIGVKSLDQLIDETVPTAIRASNELDLPNAMTEYEYLNMVKQIAKKNKLYKSYIGLGYYGTITPPVILRNIFENPGWYTQYTPYQAEIAQGRLEALLNFQTMVSDLTGMPIANASLLDEATAAAEAMAMAFSHKNRKSKTNEFNTFLVSDKVLPQTIDVLYTRAIPLNIEIVIMDAANADVTESVFGILLQYPCEDGTVEDYSALAATVKENNAFVIVAADILSLALLTPPGEFGADIVVGSTQRLGVPLGYGGPHAAYFATKDDFKRQMPGRIIGVSVDSYGNRALRMALQTREQHIKREKATSNICTAQALLAIIASMYAVYHGQKGIKAIAERVHGFTQITAIKLADLGFEIVNTHYFDTIKVYVGDLKNAIHSTALANEINLRYFEDNHIGISIDETITVKDLENLINVFATVKNAESVNLDWNDLQAIAEDLNYQIPRSVVRQSEFLTHPVFNSYHSETEMMRYIKRLENKDLSLMHSMISLGSCTMKLNAAAELIPVTWEEFGGLHPFVPTNQAAGYSQIINELSAYLSEATGFAACSLQPNSGAQGEYTGLLTIKAYHEANGDFHRNVAIIPASAHGTNPASAVMAGMKVVVVKCDDQGNIDLEDLTAKVEANKENLSCLMVTYPSTHGVFETSIKEICKLIHNNGGKVYMDGANMNAQVGLTSPGLIDADVCHLNLHKTFAIPHGGGGPGMGPICVNESLAPFLPKHKLVDGVGGEKGIRAVSAAPYGSASILLISYGYIRMLGKVGVTDSTKYAILNANYIKARLQEVFEVLYTGEHGHSAHELILDLRKFKKISAEDVAKRLMDYGFHAPTLSFPVSGTVMIEPTESESKEELDRFCDAMLSIHKEMVQVEIGETDAQNNLLKNAPHTITDITSNEWNRPYSREAAAYPLPYVRERKFWASVGRVNNAAGDRNLVCTCLPIEAYA
jgi:glycine dehydrogenase